MSTLNIGLRTTPYLDLSVGATGLVMAGLGTLGFINPSTFTKAFDIQISSPESRKITSDLLNIWASRDVALGTVTMAAAYYGDTKMMGFCMIGATLVAISDGIVNRGTVKGGEWKHWPAAAITAGIAAFCFGYI
jgi:hypothetical protein